MSDRAGGLDPRKWKREHKGALIAAILFGAALGICWQLGTGFWNYNNAYVTERYINELIAKAAFLAFVGGSLVYIRQILRS